MTMLAWNESALKGTAHTKINIAAHQVRSQTENTSVVSKLKSDLICTHSIPVFKLVRANTFSVAAAVRTSAWNKSFENQFDILGFQRGRTSHRSYLIYLFIVVVFLENAAVLFCCSRNVWWSVKHLAFHRHGSEYILTEFSFLEWTFKIRLLIFMHPITNFTQNISCPKTT